MEKKKAANAPRFIFMNPNLEKNPKFKKSEKPYLKKVGKANNFSVWLVDGRYIRDKICEDFVNFGQHFVFNFIPKHEFWIAQESSPDELNYYVTHLLVEHRLMASGMEYESAYQGAAKAEAKERRKSDIFKQLKKADHAEILRMVRIRLIKKYSGKIKVWVVDGNLVRTLLLIDFAGGGHDKVYDFIPKNEIWLDNDIKKSELKYILLHEMHERYMMAKGMDYRKAHKSATLIEDSSRGTRGKVRPLVRKEIKKNESLKN
jgi:hypothetical protein